MRRPALVLLLVVGLLFPLVSPALVVAVDEPTLTLEKVTDEQSGDGVTPADGDTAHEESLNGVTPSDGLEPAGLYKLAGTLALPESDEASSDISIHVIAKQVGADHEHIVAVVVGAGASRADFQLFVPNGQYEVTYWVETIDRYVQYGTPQVIEVLDQDADAISFVLQAGHRLSGTISAPSGDTVEEDITITVQAERLPGQSLQQAIFIESGSTAAEYAFVVATGNYELSYVLDNPRGYLPQGSYSSGDGPSGLWVDRDMTDMNFVLKREGLISGQVVIENDDTLNSALSVFIFAQSLTGQGLYSNVVVMDPNSARVDYSLTVDADDTYRLGYRLLEDNAVPYISRAYFSNEGMVLTWSSGSTVTGDTGNINLTLMRGYILSGTIHLPSPSPAGGIGISICSGLLSSYVFIPEGVESADFSLTVPPGDNSLHYSMWERDASEHGYVHMAYYSSAGMTLSPQGAEVLNVCDHIEDLNLHVVRAHRVQGRVRLPEQEAAPYLMRVQVKAQAAAYSYSTEVVIHRNHYDASYSLSLPPGVYSLSYKFLGESPYQPYGYYVGQDGTSSIEVNGDLENVDIAIVTGHTISGRLLLPEGYDLTESLAVTVWARHVSEHINHSHFTDVTISPETSYADFSLVVPTGNYNLHYRIESSSDLLNPGHYLAEDGSEVIEVRGDLSGMDIELETGVLITGEVRLPAEASSDTMLWIEARAEDRVYLAYAPIASGSSNGYYQLAVSPNVEYLISYHIEGGGNPSFIPQGYYSSVAGTIDDRALATPVLVAEPLTVDIDVLAGYLLTGTVSLPAGFALPDNGVWVSVGTEQGVSTTVRLLSRSGTFSLAVAPGEHRVYYVISTHISPVPGLISQGYYNIYGTTSIREQATLVDARDSDVEGINFELLAGQAISGEVVLPDGFTAPQNGLPVHISTAGFWTWASIRPGESRAPFSLNVTPGTYQLRYHIPSDYQGSEFVRQGHYSASGTVLSQHEAEHLVVTENISGLEFKLLAGCSISGEVRLPDGEIAPEGGLRVQVSNNRGAWTEVYIRPGESSAPYSLTVIPGSNNIVSYNLVNYSGDEYVRHAFYSESGSTVIQDGAQQINAAGNIDNINLDVVRGHRLTGKIVLPLAAPAGGLRVQLNTNGAWTHTTVLEGQTVADYTLVVPAGEYRVQYWISSWDYSGTDYVQSGYYSDSGTVASWEAASPVSVSGEVSGIDIAVMFGTELGGFISLPEGLVAPEGGLRVRVSSDSGVSTEVLMPAGSHSARFALTVAADSHHRLSYELINYGGVQFIRRGYYSDSGSVLSWGQATSVHVPNGGRTGLSLGLIGGHAISGTVQLPHGHVAPAGGLKVNISNYEGAWTQVSIAGGASEASYNLVVPRGQYQVGYHISAHDYIGGKYYRQAFIGASGMTTNHWESRFIPVEGDVSGMDIEILTGTSIKGIVTLPADAVAPAGGLWIQIHGDAGSGAWTEVLIPAGSSSAGFSLTVLPGQANRISYQLNSSNTNHSYITRGYYHSQGTTPHYEQAELVPSDGSATDIELHLLTGPVVSGVISLPEDYPELSQALRVQIGNMQGVWNNVIIPAGSREAAYQLVLPEGQHRLCYWVSQWDYQADDLVRQGYYAEDSTTAEMMNAEWLVVSASGATADLQLIRGETISGEIKLPDGRYAPVGGIRVQVDNNVGAWTEVFIPENQDRATFALVVGPGSSHRIRYHLGGISQGDYVSYGYYNRDAQGYVTGQWHEATLVQAGATEVVFELMRASIRGQVVTPDFVPASGGWVDVRSHNGEWVASAPVGAAGVFALGQIPDGQYIVRAYPTNNTQYSMSPEVTMLVESGSVIGDLVVPLSRVQLEGQICMPNGNAQSFGWVQVYRVTSDSLQWFASYGADASGRFRVGGLSDGMYSLRAYPQRADLYTPSEWIELVVQSGEVQVVEGELSAGTLSVFLTEPQISGTVKGPGGETVSFGWVEVRSAEGNYELSTGLDSLGRFTLHGLAEGEYTLTAFPERNSKFTRSLPVQVTVGSQGVTLTLTEPQIGGYVKTPSGEPVQEGWVEVTRDGQWVTSVGLTADGYYKLSNLPAGDYSLRACVPASSPFASGVLTRVEVTEAVTLQQNLTVTSVGISGIVRATADADLEGIWVELGDIQGNWLLSVPVDASGDFKLPSLTDGSYMVQAFAPEGSEHDSSTAIEFNVHDGNVPTQLELVLEAKPRAQMFSFFAASVASSLLGDNPPNVPQEAAIVGVNLSSASHQTGNSTVLTVTVDTKHVAKGSSVKATLVQNQLPVDGVAVSMATVADNKATLTLNLPSDIPVGQYYVQIQIEAEGLVNTSSSYSVHAAGQAAITQIALSGNSHIEGTDVDVTVTLTTANVSEETALRVTFRDAISNAVVSGVSGGSVVVANAGRVTLFIPANVPDGAYTVEVSVGDLRTEVGYTILPQPPQVNEAPIASNVRVNGSAEVGRTLTGTYDYSDPDGDQEGASEFQWYRGNKADGSDKTPVASANSTTHLITEDDLGMFIFFEVTPVASSGASHGRSVLSAPTTRIQEQGENLPPVATNVMISGQALVGNTLVGLYTYADADGDLEGESIYKWYRASSSDGAHRFFIASGREHVVTIDDVGMYLFFEVTPKAASGVAEGLPVMSPASALVRDPSTVASIEAAIEAIQQLPAVSSIQLGHKAAVVAARVKVNEALNAGATLSDITDINKLEACEARIAELEAEVAAAIALATQAVEQAESTRLQADVDAAIILIEALPAGVEKEQLRDRLNAIVVDVPVTPPPTDDPADPPVEPEPPVVPVDPTPPVDPIPVEPGPVTPDPTPVTPTPPVQEPTEPPTGDDDNYFLREVVVDESGEVTQILTLTEEAQTAIDTAKADGKTVAEFVVPVVEPFEGEELPLLTEIVVPSSLLVAAEGLGIRLVTSHVVLELSSEAVIKLAEGGQDMAVVLGKGNAELVTNIVAERGKVLREPISIKTSLLGETRVTLAFDLELPHDEVEREAFLANLGIFVIHSDGEEVLIRDIELTIDEEMDSLVAVSFWVDKFSTFALVRVVEQTEQPTEPLIVRTLINSRTYTVQAESKAFDSETAFRANPTTTVMAIRLFEELGATFTFDRVEGIGVITMRYDEVVVVLKDGSDLMQITDESGTREATMRAAAVITNGRTYIPTRDVSENLGFQVDWVREDDSITITRK